ncbi:MAG: MFS transporter [Actinomycetota bacterium]
MPDIHAGRGERPFSAWHRAAGYGLYIAVLTAGYYYNLTFVQLGLIDLGERRVGLTGTTVSAAMGALALAALVAALAMGWTMDRRGWGADLRVKLRILFGVVLAQTLLTIAAPFVLTAGAFLAWVAVCSLSIGTGIPVTFSLMLDLIPNRHRGHVAATTAGLAFFVAALYPREWRVEEFATVMTWGMVPAVGIFALLAFPPRGPVRDLVATLADGAARHGPGRFVRPPHRPSRAVFWGLVAVMFGVFFIDSLGFLRIIEAPTYILSSWQSPETGPRLFIAVTHVVGAAMAGVLYTAFDRRWLIVWILGLFAFTHLLYTSHILVGPSGMDPPLVLPLFYVLAVSFYTTLNFALWPDLSTAKDIGMRTALGVGIAGWLASFLSTALALWSKSSDLSLLAHLRYVNALALVLAVGVPVMLYLARVRRLALAHPTLEAT